MPWPEHPSRRLALTMAPLNSVPMTNLSDDPYLALLGPPPAGQTVSFRLRFALNAAVLAPSIHNTQPWRFRIYDGPAPHVDMLMDASRRLVSLDPNHRQQVISCGAALAAYELGLRGCGLAARIEPFPTDGDPATVARIHLTERPGPDLQARELWPALRERRSYRGPMTEAPIELWLRHRLTRLAAPGSRLHFVPSAQWRTVERLIAAANLELDQSVPIHDEIRNWTRETERTRDGVPAANWQRTSEQSAGAPVVQRDFAEGRDLAGSTPTVGVEPGPTLAVMMSRGDTQLDWLKAGQSLLTVALAIQTEKAALGYVDQPVEIPIIRDELAAELRPISAAYRVPQLVLRLGYPAGAMPPASPRRPVQDVLLPLTEKRFGC
jgi:nitroreductase